LIEALLIYTRFIYSPDNLGTAKDIFCSSSKVQSSTPTQISEQLADFAAVLFIIESHKWLALFARPQLRITSPAQHNGLQ
jgi:hypothetical protein